MESITSSDGIHHTSAAGFNDISAAGINDSTPGFNDTTPQSAALNSRRLLANGGMADLTTIMTNRHQLAGLPYTSLQLTWESCLKRATPMVALVTWGTHRVNIQQNNSASLQIRDQSFFHQTENQAGILNHARFTLFGSLHASNGSFDQDLDCLLETHKYAEEWVESHSFQFYEFQVEKDFLYVGGYGSEHYVGFIGKELWFFEEEQGQIKVQPE